MNADNEIMAMMQKHRREQEERSSRARSSVIRALRSAGVKRVDIRFDGSGDSGQIEEIVYSPAQGKGFGTSEVPDTKREFTDWSQGEPRKVARNHTHDELVEEACYGILFSEHPGWEINEGSYGDFVIDVASDKISLNFNQRIESVESYDEEY